MSSFSLNLPRSANTSDPKLLAVVDPLYSAMGSIYNNFVYACGVITPPISQFSYLADTPGGSISIHNLNRMYCEAGEVLALGNLIYLYLDGDVLKAKLAIGGAGNKRAVGYVNYPATIGTVAELIIGSGVVQIGGAIPESQYYLSDATPGGITDTAPSSGLVQIIGTGIATDLLYFHCF